MSSIYSICDSNYRHENPTQNDLMNDDWKKKSPSLSTLNGKKFQAYEINAPPPIYVSSFIINLPIIKHHKQQDLQRTRLNNNKMPEYTMIEIEEKVFSELFERLEPDFSGNVTLTNERSSCFLFDLVVYWGMILIAGSVIGVITILERFA